MTTAGAASNSPNRMGNADAGMKLKTDATSQLKQALGGEDFLSLDDLLKRAQGGMQAAGAQNPLQPGGVGGPEVAKAPENPDGSGVPGTQGASTFNSLC